MDLVTAVVIAMIIVLMLFIAFTLTQAQKQPVKSKEAKKQEIIESYTKQLHDALLPLQNNREAMKTKKSALLKTFSIELSRNIFFDDDEMRDIITTLASYDVNNA